ncbi:hypothetical protein L7F22_040288 [Adiantum nelumboides]|nr:hypothetical protein [Adiantum nelumboides]
MAPSISLKLLLIISFLLACAQNLQFSFPMFDPNDLSGLNFSDNSGHVDSDALQVTRNSGSNPRDQLSNTSDQITLNQPLQLWHRSHTYIAFFNTLSSSTWVPSTAASGGGMTFMFSSRRAIDNLPDSSGSSLGLIDSTSPSQGSQFVAIEFDTFKDISFDPDGNHVGIDAKGTVNSLLNVSLSPLNVTLTNTSRRDDKNTSVWIDYDGNHFTFDVYLANQGPNPNLSTRPVVPVISAHHIDLHDHLPEPVYVGFSASVGTILESHCVVKWDFYSISFPGDQKKPNIAIILTCSIVGGVAIAVLLVLFLARKRRRHKRNIEMEDLTNLHYGPRKFEYNDLKKATNGFSEESSLGHGGFGAVYKGMLRSDNGITTEVAVKCLSPKSKQGEKEFKAEVMSMGRMRHKNLVQLLGWSYGGSRLMLVYEYLPNRSLDRWIGQGQERGEVMGWERRFQCKNQRFWASQAHQDGSRKRPHRHRCRHIRLHGPGDARIGHCQQRTDIYSLGIITIKVATGHRISMDFLHRLTRLLEDSSPAVEEVADPRLSSFTPNQLELLLRLGLACCHPHPPARPSIREVVHALSMTGASPAMAAPSLSSFAGSYASTTPRMQTTESSLAAMEVSTGR